jgi:hypothetical protein
MVHRGAFFHILGSRPLSSPNKRKTQHRDRKSDPS